MDTYRRNFGLVSLPEVVSEIVLDVVAEVLLEVLIKLQNLHQSTDVQTLEVTVGQCSDVTGRLHHDVIAVLQVPLNVASHQIALTCGGSRSSLAGERVD